VESPDLASKREKLRKDTADLLDKLEAIVAKPGVAAFLRRSVLRLSFSMFELARRAYELERKLEMGGLMRWTLLRVSINALRQARSLTPESPGVHFDLGVTYLESDTRLQQKSPCIPRLAFRQLARMPGRI